MKAILPFFLLCFSYVYAQGCGCDHTISSGTSDVNGNVLSISPGDTICITSGARDRIKFRNFSGTETNPVVVINCGGQVSIDPTTFSYGIKVENVDYVKFTGTGDVSEEYGFRISGTTGYGMDLGLLSNHFEIDHFEFEETGDYALYSKNEPTCDLSANKGHFTLEDVNLNHLHIFDCNKGIRLGHIDYDLGVVNGTCGTLEPHGIENLQITHSIIEDITGGDAIRIYGTEGYIANNTFDNVAGRGITVGTHCDIIFNQNSISNTDDEGYRALGSGRNELHNNVFYSNGDGSHNAIELAFEDASAHALGNVVVFSNNTVVNSALHHFSIISPAYATDYSYIRNNVFLNPGATPNPSYEYSPYLNITDTTDFVLSNNCYSTDYTALKFVGYSTNNFRLTHESPLINNGYEALTEEDFDSAPRNLAGNTDIGAFEYVPERIAYFNQLPLQGLYVNDFKYILGDEGAENDLLSYASDSGFNYLLLYNLSYIHSNMYDLTELETADVFADFIEKAKTEYGIVQIGVVGETDASFDKIEEFNDLYNSDWYRTVDVLNLEFEFWANTSSSNFIYYCSTYLTPNSFSCNNSGAFSFAFGEMDDIDQRADNMGVLSEIYLGSPTNQQMLDLSELCDRVLLHCYRTSDVYTNGNSIYNYKKERVEQIALSTRKPAIMPIFAATPEFMGTWLETHTLAQPMNTWLYGQNSFDDASSEVQDLTIAGYQWYRYTDLIEMTNRSFITGTYGEEEVEEEIEIMSSSNQPSQSNLKVSPNPFYEHTTIYFGQDLKGQYSVKIFDVLGQEILLYANVTGSQLEIQRNDLRRGIYIVVLVDNVTGEEVEKEKMVVD